MSNIVTQFKAARRASVPIIIIKTADYNSLMSAISNAGITDGTIKEDDKEPPPAPLLQWDVNRGICAIGESKSSEGAEVEVTRSQDPALKTANPQEAMKAAVDRM